MLAQPLSTPMQFYSPKSCILSENMPTLRITDWHHNHCNVWSLVSVQMVRRTTGTFMSIIQRDISLMYLV